MSQPTSDAKSVCPLCGQDNHCAASAGLNPEGCWCMTAKFSKKLLELVPPEQRRKSCICQSCLDRFNADTCSFTRNL